MVKGQQTPGRFTYLAAALLFLLFHLAITPHLVHHAFEPPDADANPCLFFSASQGCHLKPSPPVELSFIQTTLDNVTPSAESWISYKISLPFWGRAPPSIAA